MLHHDRPQAGHPLCQVAAHSKVIHAHMPKWLSHHKASVCVRIQHDLGLVPCDLTHPLISCKWTKGFAEEEDMHQSHLMDSCLSPASVHWQAKGSPLRQSMSLICKSLERVLIHMKHVVTS